MYIGNKYIPTATLTILGLVWVGFLVLLGMMLSARFVKTSFQKRMQSALSPQEDESTEMTEEVHEGEMGQSLVSRVITPIVKKLGARMKTNGKGLAGSQLRDMLEQAGHPFGMYFPEYMGFKLFCFVLFTGLGIVSSFFVIPLLLRVAEVPAEPDVVILGQILWGVVFMYAGFSGPTFWLRRIINLRIKKIRKSMADVVDLIVLAIEAGLGFDMAVGEAVAKTQGPLTDELRRVLDEVRVGKPQEDAFRDMATRCRMPELSLLVAAIAQAMRMGTGLAQAMRLQATEIRERRMAFIKEQAGKLPVKMMLPLVLFIFPALFVVILGPAAVQISEMSARGELNF